MHPCSFQGFVALHQILMAFGISLPILELLTVLWPPALSLSCFFLQPGAAGVSSSGGERWCLAFKASWGSPQAAVPTLAAPSSINGPWG